MSPYDFQQAWTGQLTDTCFLVRDIEFKTGWRTNFLNRHLNFEGCILQVVEASDIISWFDREGQPQVFLEPEFDSNEVVPGRCSNHNLIIAW